MIKVALFDVDNLIIKRHEYFSQFLAREYDIPNEKVLEFFKNEFKLCSLGKADLKEEVVKYFDKWNWKGTVEDLLKIWFENEKDIDQEVINQVQKFRDREIRCYLATNNEKYRLSYLLDNLNLKEYFDGAFASCEIGHSKVEEKFFKIVFERLGNVKPEEVVFWDSDENLVEVAGKLGIDSRLYSNPSDLNI